MPPKADTKALPEADSPEPKKKRGKKLFIILFILLLTLGGAGAGGYWWLYLRQPGEPTAEGEASTPGAETQEQATNSANSGAKQEGTKIERQSGLPRNSPGGIVVPLPPVRVNLADPAGRRYLDIESEVEISENMTAELQKNSARVRDAIILLLASKTYEQVATPDGKVILKGEMAARINQILGSARVVQIYFTKFVVE